MTVVQLNTRRRDEQSTDSRRMSFVPVGGTEMMAHALVVVCGLACCTALVVAGHPVWGGALLFLALVYAEMHF